MSPLPILLALATVWTVAGVALVVGAQRRPEPTSSFRLIGGGTALVGLALGVAASRPEPMAADPFLLQLLTPGLAGLGIGTLVATPSWRHRASLLDGVLLAHTVAGLALVAVASGRAGDWGFLLPAGAAAFLGVLGVALMAMSMLPQDLQPVPGTVPPAIALAAVAVASIGTVATAAEGGTISPGLLGAWALPPLTALVMALRPVPTYREPDFAGAQRPSPRRLVVLSVLAVLPAVAAAVSAPGLLVAALVAAVAAVLVLAMRVAVSARFDIADAEAAADVRFDALVEHAAEVLALLDEDDRLFYISRAVQDTFHVPPADVLGLSPVQLAHPEDVEEVLAILGRVRERPGVPLHARLRLLDGHGAARHVEATAVDLRHVPGVRAVSLTVRDITERVTLEAELVRQARTDSLTGLPKRTVLIERIDHVLTARRPRAALLFIDLDDFKLVNDGYGHATGDEVLAVLAARLRTCIRTHDTPGRVGGDEFAVLLEELDGDAVERALDVAHRIAQEAYEPLEVEGEPLRMRLSVGVALPEEGMTTAELFAAADAAMYEAKRERSGVALYEPGMRGPSRSRLRLLRDVRTAIEDGAISLAYQPIVEADTLHLHGVEALLRWEHPSLGPIAPDLVLDNADAVGMLGELTECIVATIAADLERWRAATDLPLPVSLNLSAEQLVRIHPEETLLALVGGPWADGLLTIEVTETSMLGDLQAAAQVLHAFRDAGCRVVIDDFGTGYASIGYLRQLPLDGLKIDREFVEGLSPAFVEASFAAVIQNLATSLGLTTTAEGVETERELDAVRALGCALVQGYHVSRPLPMDQLLAWAQPQLTGSA